VDQPPDLINNQYLTGNPSTDQTEKSSFYTYTHLLDGNPHNVLEIL